MTMLFTTVLSIVFVGIIVTIFVGIWNGWDPKVVSHQFKIPVLAPLWKEENELLKTMELTNGLEDCMKLCYQ
jgi:hypothetical protein